MTDTAQQGNNPPSPSTQQKTQGNRPQGSAQPRGAGSGASANATRSRNLVDWPPPIKTHAEHVEELEEQAQENEDYNKAVNDAQTNVVKNAMEIVGHPTYPLSDPELESESRQQVLEDYLAANDPAKKKERLKGEMDARAKRDKAQADAMYAKT
jgi:hypothetical protein